MTTQQSLDTLKALRITLVSNVTGIQGQVDALDIAITQLEGGYKIDQGTIDAAINTAKQTLKDKLVTLQEEV